MTTIFCSDRLEKLFGSVQSDLLPDPENKFGNWNGHLFILDRKKNLIFTHVKTAYSFVLINIKKAELKNFDNLFRESLIKQLYNDLRINESQEIKIREWLSDIQLTKMNYKRKVPSAIKDFITLIKQEAYRKGGLGQLTNLSIGYGLNNHFMGTKLKAGAKKYSIPKELMESLIK
jgi:hypothetical protein